MELVALPAFADNYIWMLHDAHEALVVDPGASAPVLAALQARGLSLSAILVTHHHADHVGGLTDLLPVLNGPIIGPASERMPVPLQTPDPAHAWHWRGLRVQALEVPGHTSDHLAFHVQADQGHSPGWLFCGDTLFSAGCGRLFEGTPAQMLDSLTRLAAWPDDTLVCCAHEYTLANLRFALAAEPDNVAAQQHLLRCEQLRAQGIPTVPSTLAQERAINPFLRTDQPTLIDQACRRGAPDTAPLAVFTALREWKNIHR